MAGGPMKVRCQAAKRLTDRFTAPPCTLPCSDIIISLANRTCLAAHLCVSSVLNDYVITTPGPTNCVDTRYCNSAHSTTFNDSFTVPHRMWQSWNRKGWLNSSRPSKRPLYTTICRYNSQGLCCVFTRQFELYTKFDTDSAIKEVK